MEETFKITECMKILRASRPTILKLIKNGELKAFRVGTVYRIKRIDLDNLMQCETDKQKTASR